MDAMKNEPSNNWDQLSSYVQELMQEHAVPGVSVGILNSGIAVSDGFGVTSVENPLSVTSKTLFQIGSITKTFTATAIMQLVEMGEIDLDAPVRSYYPDFRVSDEETSSKVTIRHLLTHTSGWVDDFWINTGVGDDAIAKFAEQMTKFDQISPLGSLFSYSNSGFMLLGYIIELVTGKSYEEAIGEFVFTPLALENCFFKPSDVMINRFSVGHIVEDGEPSIADSWARPRATNPSGSLVSNVDDLLKYARFYLEGGKTYDGNQILETDTIRMMQTPQQDRWADREYVGLGWMLDFENTEKIVQHWGGTLGQISTLQILPDHNFAFAILTNADTGAKLIGPTIKWCLREYIGIETEEPEPIDVRLDKRKEIEGRYMLTGIDHVDLRLLGERLVAQVVPAGEDPAEDSPLASPYTLEFIEEDRLVMVDGRFEGSNVDLFRDASGTVKWLRLGGAVHIREPN
jgi:CubicO group peptidase (beta-lactamase class C family)